MEALRKHPLRSGDYSSIFRANRNEFLRRCVTTASFLGLRVGQHDAVRLSPMLEEDILGRRATLWVPILIGRTYEDLRRPRRGCRGIWAGRIRHPYALVRPGEREGYRIAGARERRRRNRHAERTLHGCVVCEDRDVLLIVHCDFAFG